MTDRVWMLPIEPLELRYSGQWLGWWERELRKLGWDVCTVHEPGVVDESIGVGQFLDAYKTHVYKAWQTRRMAEHLLHGRVHDGDWVFLHDAWTPTLTALAYMRAVGRVRFKLAGFLHAGTWDPHDHLSRCGMAFWARGVEQSWLQSLDVVFVATHFHAELLCDAFGENLRRKLRVVGLPLYLDDVLAAGKPLSWPQRPRRVVFPHRLAPEKQPDQFDALRRLYRHRWPRDEVEWVSTADRVQTRAEYYELLGCSRVSFSAALQETFGIAVQESVMLGCYPVLPNRLSFAELFPQDGCRYETLEQATELVRAGLDAERSYVMSEPRRWETTISRVSDALRCTPGGVL